MTRLAILLAFTVLLLPGVAAQTGPRDQCAKSCTPTASDSNPQSTYDGPVRVFLYPSSLRAGTLTTVDNQPVEQVTPPVNRLLGSLCQRVQWTMGTVVSKTDLGGRTRVDAWMPDRGVRLGGENAELVLYARPSAPLMLASASVDVTIRDDIGASFDHGSLAAFGSIQVEPALMGQTWELRVPLTLNRNIWFAHSGPTRQMFVDATVCSISTPYAGTTASEFTFVTSPKLPSRLVLSIEDPVNFTSFRHEFRDGHLVVQAEILGVLGAYDVGPPTLSLSNWDHPRFARTLPPTEIDDSIHHDDPNRPVRLTWKVPVQDLPVAKPIHMQVHAANLQSTFYAVSRATTEIVVFRGVASDGSETPGAFWPIYLLLVPAAVLGFKRLRK